MISLWLNDAGEISSTTKVTKVGESYYFHIKKALKDLTGIDGKTEYPIIYNKEENELRIKLPDGR